MDEIVSAIFRASLYLVSILIAFFYGRLYEEDRQKKRNNPKNWE